MSSGRPPKPFHETCARTKKKRRIQNLRTEVPTEQLTFSAQMKLKAGKKIDASKIIKDISSNPGHVTKYRKTFHTLQNKTEKLTPAEALSIFVEAGLIRNQYEIGHINIRQMRKRKYHKPFSKKTLEMLLPGQVAISEDSVEEEMNEEEDVFNEEDAISSGGFPHRR
ncbi:hypothetical protein AVEN_94890-1 [Araneus ventricosus]|uniref:Uncharacterized protein n=1 Tax=Araneus ventricosus TaxID=182803 RepID=A0A4Y2RHI6_ARAVE|nr:hypothetical protein AVEN_94890-1 [Araneus ventricosus]